MTLSGYEEKVGLPVVRGGTRRGAGGSVSVRGLSAGDEDGLRAMFRRLSRETIYRRFLMPYPRVPESLAVHLARHTDGRSLVAVGGGGIVGHAMYAGETGDEAEVAIVVEDGWQSRGVGKRLLAELARRAAGRGVETFTGVALGENRRVLDLVDAVFAGAGYEIRAGSYDIHMPLKSLRPEIRSAARAAGGRPISRRKGREHRRQETP
jgi:GNAT superfamily N-acetyltransferase